jgi:ATP-binding cassette subfamily B protein
VQEAITFGSVSPVRALGAAHAAHVHEFISRLPERYQTSLPEAPISGGEAQRLGLARAWYASRLLVLDDATSSLDTATVRQISRTLLDDRIRRTRLLVTHRAATAAPMGPSARARSTGGSVNWSSRSATS